MAFAISTAGVPRLNSYSDALAAFEKASLKPWKNGGEDLPFPQKRSRSYGIRQLTDGSIAFRFHSTDVVTWYPDNSCTLQPYMSQSTQAFANCLLPNHATVTSACSRLVIGGWRDGWAYPLGGRPVRIGGPDDVVATGMVFECKRVNRKAAKAALARTRYTEYRNWYQLMAPMLTGPAAGEWLHEEDVLRYLEDPEKWHSLMVAWNDKGRPDKVRQIIYTRFRAEVFYAERVDKLPTSALRNNNWYAVVA